MATLTYEAIATITLSGSASSVTFSSINQSYGDLILVHSGTPTSSGLKTVNLRFNNDTGTNYSRVTVDSIGNGSYTSTDSGLRIGLIDGRAVNIWQIIDYSAEDKYKTLLARANISSAVRASAGRWSNTSAITSIEVFPENVDFAAGSTFSLYGIAK